jgi:valyl-tRNA synthetase
MEKTYQPDIFERTWYAHWEKQGYFKPTLGGTPFCIMLPPPNVTGQLHMGHAFQDTLMDALIRYHRMRGDNTLWQMGTDHAGIATQMVVERQLANQNTSRHDLGREAFIDKVWAWKKISGDHITQQMRRLGTSGDWSRERFTLDEGLSQAVQTVFIQLYQEGLIYRGERLVNWDPIFQTAISDLEVLTEEEKGFLWHIRYPVVDSQEWVVVATTRPETLLGDEAVAVHPDDARYQHLIGQTVLLPLTQKRIPILADTFVDPTFGTGCVKITPAHDFNDYQVGLRHQLPLVSILNRDVTLNDKVPLPYQGLTCADARARILADLKEQGYLVHQEPHTLKIPRGDRSGAIIEPLLTPQWYVKMGPLAEPAIAAVHQKRIRFVPDIWENTYFSWMENIQDWCISRQLWWGHRIPAWYDDVGQMYVGESEAAIRQAHAIPASTPLHQDPDVLDTWFSSALWPFSTLGWPEKTADLSTYYPTQVLVTGFDIIFFWVARMIMMGLKFTHQIPFHTVYVHGLIQDAEGQKMSKSKGNTIDPLDVIDGISLPDLLAKRTQGLMQPHLKEAILKATQKQFPEGIEPHGTDALRFTFCALASQNRHIRFDLAKVAGYKHFCNKLWNAARYGLMQAEGETISPVPPTLPINQWIVTELQILIQEVTQQFDQYRFDLAAQALYDFTWNTYCDWYLELSKSIMSPETRYTLLSVLETLLRLLHPIMPFITEEIWQRLKPTLKIEGDSIMLVAYPVADSAQIHSEAVQEITFIQAMITAIRNIRGEMHIPPHQKVSLQLRGGSTLQQKYVHHHENVLQSLGKASNIAWGLEPPKLSAQARVGEIDVYITDFMDVKAELARLQKELELQSANITRLEIKLNNPDYLEKAPRAVVEKEKEKLLLAQNALERIKTQIGCLGNE